MSKHDIAGRWLRVSTGQQDEANQEPDINQWITDHHYTTGPTYTLRKSASKGNHQTALDQVVDDMKNGRLTVLVVWHFDRIERRGAWNAFDLARQVREAGGRIEYVRSTHLNELHDFSDTFLAMEADRARLESKRTSERVRATHERIRSNGGVHGKASYGFRLAGERYNKTLIVHEPEAAILREMADRYLSGESIGVIESDFNARKVGGQKWSQRKIARLLRSPAAAGRRVKHDKNGRPLIETVSRHEAIISWSEHQQICARLDSRAHRQGISPGITPMLTGVLFDADGNRMHIINRNRNGGQYYSRRSNSTVSVLDMNARVDQLLGGNTEPFMVPRVVPGANHADEISQLRRDLSELDMLTEGYDEDHARLVARIRELARQDADNPSEDRMEMVPSGRTIGEMWMGMSDAQKHDWLHAANARVVWFGEGHRDGELWSIDLD